MPFKPGYRRFKIKNVSGIDDFRSIHEVVSRRFKRLYDEQDAFPDILLIDGGKGQLSSAVAAFETLEIDPPVLLSIAKKEEELNSIASPYAIVNGESFSWFGVRSLRFLQSL